MISASGVNFGYSGKKLFENVNIKFKPGNCYGLIGANGAGKSTFLKILSGEISDYYGDVAVDPGERIAVLKQDHSIHDNDEVLKTVIMGHDTLWKVMKEKDEIYEKPDFSDEDGIRASELENEFAEMGGWEAETDAAALLEGLGIPEKLHTQTVAEMTGNDKVKVLLAQALFGKPDVLLLDEPTNHLDMKATHWLENFLYNFENTVIVVSHDRHFLNKVCTHIADIDFGKITIYTGNYDFWYKSSQLAQELRREQQKKAKEKAKELQDFIARFSANAAKAKQATSRQKQLEKLNIDDLPRSTRKYPYIAFKPEREAGKNLLMVKGLSKSIDGEVIFKNLDFVVNKGDKILFLAEKDRIITTLFNILSGREEADEGSFEWGVTTTQDYLSLDHSVNFPEPDLNIIDWLRQYSANKEETYVRGFLGRMLFPGEDALKKVGVLSGGEKVRCLLSKAMISESNVLLMNGPTNHLDLETITSLNDGLIRFDGTLLFSDHDHEFVQTVATRIIDIKGDNFVDKETTFDDYLGLVD